MVTYVYCSILNSLFLSLFVDYALTSTYIGLCTVYIVFISTALAKVCNEYLEDGGYHVRYYILIIVAIVLVIGQIRELKYLVPFSAVANVFLVITFGITFYYIFNVELTLDGKENIVSISQMVRLGTDTSKVLCTNTSLFAAHLLLNGHLCLGRYRFRPSDREFHEPSSGFPGLSRHSQHLHGILDDPLCGYRILWLCAIRGCGQGEHHTESSPRRLVSNRDNVMEIPI